MTDASVPKPTQRALVQATLVDLAKTGDGRVAVGDIIRGAIQRDLTQHDGTVFHGGRTPAASARRALYSVLNASDLLVRDGRGYLRIHLDALQDVILHGDAWEVLPLIPTDSISTIIADPPWTHLATHRSRGSTTRMTSNGYFAERDADEPLLREFVRVLKPGGYLCLYMPPFQASSHHIWAAVLDVTQRLGFGAVREVVWKKQRGMGYRWTGTHEPILCFSKGSPRECLDRRATSVVDAPAPRGSHRTAFQDFTAEDDAEWGRWVEEFGKAARIPREVRKMLKGRYHDTEKPVEVARHLLRVAGDEGGLLVDCFAGAGHACVAAKEAGMAFVAVEADPRVVHHLLAPRLAGRVRAVVEVSGGLA